MTEIALKLERKQLESKLLDMAFERIELSVASAMLLSTLIVAALWPIIEHERLLAWLGVMAVVQALNFFYARRYKSARGIESESHKWQAGLAAGGVAAGLCWGSTVFSFPSTPFNPQSVLGIFILPSTPFDPVTVVLMFILAGVAAYVTVAMAFVPLLAMAFLTCTLLPLSIWLLSFGEHMYVVMGLIALSYLGVMVMLSRRMHATVCSLISVSEENRGLRTTQQESDWRMHRLFESAPGFFYTACMTPDGKSSMPFVSAGIHELFDLTSEDVADCMSPLFALLRAEDIERIVDAREASRKNLTPFYIEFRINHRIKGERWIELHSQPKREPDGSTYWHGFMQDITGRKSMESELRLKEDVLDQARLGVYLIDENARITYVNNEACRALGYSREALLAKTIPEIDASVSLDASLAVRQKTLDDGAFTFETMHVRCDGSLLPVEIWASTHEYRGKKIGVALAADITERKNADHTRNKLARALKLLSECGMLLVHAKNERKLLDDTCRLAVEIGGYRMAWVGFAENDEHKTVHPVAQSGFEEGYLDGINVTWADTERGQGPIAITIRTGGATINHDFQTNQGLTPWREAAIRRGYRSSIALPLVGEGQVLGTLNIYSAEVRAFSNDEEVALLQKLADNLALGIGMLRTRAAQARMAAELAASERDFRSLAENMPDNVARWDLEGRYLYLNPVHERILGLSAQDVLGKSLPEIYGEAFLNNGPSGVTLAITTGKPVLIERFVMPGENGEIRFHDIKSVPEFDAEGRLISVLGIGRDMTDIYRMQDTIAAREQAFRSLAESSPDYIIRYDREGRTRYLNTSLLHLLGLDSVEEVMGKRPSETWPDGRFDQLEQAAKQAIESGSMKKFEMMTPGEKGELTYSNIFVVPEFGVNGDIVGTIAFGRDVTAIREVERRLAHFIDNLPGLVYIFRLTEDGQASFPYMSQASEEFYGFKAEDVKDDMAPLHALTHPDDRPVIEAAIAESARLMTPLRVELRVCRPGQSERWLETRSVPESQPDGSIHWYGLMLDITERKLLESGLQSYSELLGSILESSPEVIIFALDRDYRYLSFNRKHQDVMRAIWGKEIAIGMSMLDMIGDHPDREAAKQGFDRALSGENFVLEEAYGDELLSRQYWQNYWAPIRSKAGEVIGLTCFVLNISERKEMELAREGTLSEALRLAQLRSAFLAQMSHELRTPLNGILGYTQNLLRGEEALGENQRSGLNIIQHSGEHLLSLINGILDHAAIEADKFELIPGDIELEPFLETIIGIIRVRAEQKNIAFSCDAGDDLPAIVRGDAQRLRQVLLNLLSNAVKFTDKGQVILRVIYPAVSRLRFEVQDSGVGIAADQLDRIFLPFEQVGEIRRRADGTGLGLAISRKLAGLMGGSINVESQPGAGSVFSFEVEIAAVQSDAAKVNAAALSERAATRSSALMPFLFAPPPQELDVLHGIALRGNMRDVTRQAARLSELDPRYVPFTEHLRQLAKGFQTKELLGFIAQYQEDKECE